MTNENPGSQTEQNAEADAQAAAVASANAETEYTAHDAQEVASYAAAASPRAASTQSRSAEPFPIRNSVNRNRADAPGSANASGSHASSASNSSARSSHKASVPRARRMNLSVTRVDPWSVTKITFMLSIAGAIIQLVAVALIWFIMNAAGLFDAVNNLGTQLSSSFNITDMISLPRVLGAVTILSVFEIVIICVLAAIGAFLYNVSSRLVGGVHVTLGDD